MRVLKLVFVKFYSNVRPEYGRTGEQDRTSGLDAGREVLQARSPELEKFLTLQKMLVPFGYARRSRGHGVALMTEFDTQLKQNMQTLLAKNEFQANSAAFGVANQIIGQGIGSLSWRQRFVYLEEVIPLLRKHRLAP
jgi:hypothetical protein